MRPREYSKRNHINPEHIKNRSRYVTNRLHSHNRPVDVPANMEPADSPATRGLTKLKDDPTNTT